MQLLINLSALLLGSRMVKVKKQLLSLNCFTSGQVSRSYARHLPPDAKCDFKLVAGFAATGALNGDARYKVAVATLLRLLMVPQQRGLCLLL